MNQTARSVIKKNVFDYFVFLDVQKKKIRSIRVIRGEKE